MFDFLSFFRGEKHDYFVHHHILEHKGDFLYVHEKLSAKTTFARENKRIILTIVATLVFSLLAVKIFFGIGAFWVALFSLGFIFYFTSLAFKMFLMIVSQFKKLPTPDQKEMKKMKDEDFPPYTVLVPMYKEGNVLARFVEHFKKIDYPKEKLDVRFLLEEDDTDTVAVARRLKLEKPFSVVILPAAGPRTKPKALNVGFLDSESEILTIYDAEDRPEPDQLKKVAWAFKNLPQNVVCIQAKLTFYNYNQNLLTKWFYAEYYTWFNYFLPGLSYFSLPIPLGGTSNHFRTSMLKKVGGWDPYNVTEDADLGIRISRLGYNSALIDTTSHQKAIPPARRTSAVTVIESATHEEATSALFNWLHQRTRWVKGYIQTALVHFRHPIKTYEDLSLKGFFSFLFFVAGTPVTNLMNLFFWGLTISQLFNLYSLPAGIPPFILTLNFLSLVAGNVFFILIHALPMFFHKKYGVAFVSLFIPIYWFLMSIATVKAVIQLFINPHYWYKTQHGVAKESA